jgi:DNA-binding Lrp family transcriptional regulator
VGVENELESARNKPKINPDKKDRRDLLIYLLWQGGRLSNSEIGVYFNLTYSAVSRRVKSISDRILSDYDLRVDYEKIKSQIKA